MSKLVGVIAFLAVLVAPYLASASELDRRRVKIVVRPRPTVVVVRG